MSGIGIEFRRIYRKHALISSLQSLGNGVTSSLAPMMAMILVLVAMYNTLDYTSVLYAQRELLSVSFTYIFLFSLVINSLFSAPIARYLADVLFVHKYEDVMPCYYTGMLMTVGTASVLGLAFAIFCICRGVDAVFALTAYCSLVAMTLVFYNMSFISAANDHKRIALFFVIGAVLAFGLSHLLCALGVEVSRSIQFSMAFGILLIAALEYAFLQARFPENSGSYRAVLAHFKHFRLLQYSGIFYTLGLFCHNFVYWASSLGVAVSGCYVYAPVYDNASFVAMYTNILSAVIYMQLTQQHFAGRYKEYSETVNTGRLSEIKVTQARMFRMIPYILGNAVKLQFICTVALFFIFTVILPGIGYYGFTTDIYPCLAGGYFMVYIMYDALMFLNYLNDQIGSFLTTLIFFSVTTLASIAASRLLPYSWQGIGLFIGALSSWTYCYIRIRHLESTFDAHVFCTGSLLKKIYQPMPDSQVYPFEESASTEGKEDAPAPRKRKPHFPPKRKKAGVTTINS